MGRFDYHCEKCGRWIEEIFASGTAPNRIACACGEPATRRWKMGRAPGIVTDNAEYHSVQLARTFPSKFAFKKYCKDKGLEILGKEEFKRTEDNWHQAPDPADLPPDKNPELREAMEHALYDVTVKREIPPPMEAIDLDTEEDLNVNGNNG